MTDNPSREPQMHSPEERANNFIDKIKKYSYRLEDVDKERLEQERNESKASTYRPSHVYINAAPLQTIMDGFQQRLNELDLLEELKGKTPETIMTREKIYDDRRKLGAIAADTASEYVHLSVSAKDETQLEEMITSIMTLADEDQGNQVPEYDIEMLNYRELIIKFGQESEETSTEE